MGGGGYQKSHILLPLLRGIAAEQKSNSDRIRSQARHFAPFALATSPVIEASASTPSRRRPGAYRGSQRRPMGRNRSPTTRDEDVGTMRVDHRFNDVGRVTSVLPGTTAITHVPVALDYGNTAASIAPVNGVLELLYVISPRSTNEVRLGGNWVPWNSAERSEDPFGGHGRSARDGARLLLKITHSLGESVLDNISMQRGRHTWKAGIEVRRVVISTITPRTARSATRRWPTSRPTRRTPWWSPA